MNVIGRIYLGTIAFAAIVIAFRAASELDIGPTGGFFIGWTLIAFAVLVPMVILIDVLRSIRE
ncbi:alpha-1D adrenoreceptor-like protein [Natrialba magadii ATCC 43099]|uniref:Alpha-1D adrenoreceptor-like protein n=1 Tax=Natrialba magadii (strain ATCC 43099 / DSM 3394 / CCM 3739 / CIP 104546 / IAM 13178 / JCM 8861 / NBRC 102185 / NCIMB 2190 / MS3) TaxID=547559 RepID=D3SQR7_NATMM|nr:alpha-1D adrenoreceptor-like protein [Natrialba magadii ATCC 43099]ELY25212.1 alpha-1D adrenoreceptor-like protein [Natrialba magadii ATCC 43099]